MTHRRPALTVLQASLDSPVLARLSALAVESRERLTSVEALIPPALRSSVQPGPIDVDQWCLLVRHNAAAAKLRQLQPLLLAHLRSRGHEVSAIRVKVQQGQPGKPGPGKR